MTDLKSAREITLDAIREIYAQTREPVSRDALINITGLQIEAAALAAASAPPGPRSSATPRKPRRAGCFPWMKGILVLPRTL